MNHMFSEEQISALVQNIPKYVYIKIAPQKQNFSVITSCSTLIRSQNMTPTKKILFEGIVPATADIAQRLGLHEGDSVLEYRRVYYANGTPVIYGRSYFNASCRVLYFPVCDGAYPLFARDLRQHRTIALCGAALKRSATILPGKN